MMAMEIGAYLLLVGAIALGVACVYACVVSTVALWKARGR